MPPISSAPASLRCPHCTAALVSVPNTESAKLTFACGYEFSRLDGFPNLIYPSRLAPSDQEFQEKYDAGADHYEEGLDWLFAAFHQDQHVVREQMVNRLGLSSGDRVLDIGCGTGGDSIHIARRLGPTGALTLADLSVGMLRIARHRLAEAEPEIDLLLANASYLPFADASFDAAFHFGGLNAFGDIRRALAELRRVVKPGGRVVIGDEGVAPWLKRKLFGRILIKANPLYRHRPPLHALPSRIRDVTVRWLLGEAFYLIDFVVAEDEPPLDLDLPIPGRGDSLRSRYYGDRAD